MYNNVSYPNEISLRKENKNAIEVTEGSIKYYIYASRVKNAFFSGRVVDGSSGGVIGGSEQGVGSIAVVIANLNNASDKTIIITDEEGNFYVEEIIPWDTYEITVDGKTWTVTPGDGDDVGIITIRDGVNLKAYLSCEDPDRVFVGSENNTEFSIVIENVGNKAASATSFAYYTFESPGMHSNIIQSNHVNPGQYIQLDGLKPGAIKRIRFNLSCDPITEEFVLNRIGFTVTDPVEGVTWKEYASIKIKTPVRLNIEAQIPVHGIVIAPYNKTYNVRTGNGITLPYSTADYTLILTSRRQGTPYSLGIDIEPNTQWDLLSDINIYKPQNTAETAASIGIYEQKMAFLFENSIDYWYIKMTNTNP